MKNTAGAVVLTFAALTPTAQARFIFEPFGGVVESFEGLVVGPNIGPSDMGSGFIIPGTSGPFTFASGVTLTAPIPNGNDGGLSGDFARGDAVFDLHTDIVHAIHVPDGTAYLAKNSLADVNFIEFAFATDMSRVGAFVMSGFDIIEMSVFDGSGMLLESLRVEPTATGIGSATNWRALFVGIKHPGIRVVRYNGNFLVLDGLQFEVPEPSAFTLLGLGALGLFMQRGRINRATTRTDSRTGTTRSLTPKPGRP